MRVQTNNPRTLAALHTREERRSSLVLHHVRLRSFRDDRSVCLSRSSPPLHREYRLIRPANRKLSIFSVISPLPVAASTVPFAIDGASSMIFDVSVVTCLSIPHSVPTLNSDPGSSVSRCTVITPCVFTSIADPQVMLYSTMAAVCECKSSVVRAELRVRRRKSAGTTPSSSDSAVRRQSTSPNCGNRGSVQTHSASSASQWGFSPTIEQYCTNCVISVALLSEIIPIDPSIDSTIDGFHGFYAIASQSSAGARGSAASRSPSCAE